MPDDRDEGFREDVEKLQHSRKQQTPQPRVNMCSAELRPTAVVLKLVWWEVNTYDAHYDANVHY